MLQKNYPIRTRFAKDIVAEVFFPERQEGRVVIFCSGAPGLSSKRELFQFLSDKGYTSIHPRYRGTWESDGEFLKRSPHQDILDVIDELIQKKKIFSFSHKKWIPLKVKEVILIGVSFGGAAVLLASCHPKVKKVIALAPVIDWTVSGPDESFQTLREYTEGAFGGAYRGPRKNWEKLKKGNFYSPLHEIKKMNGQKILLFHAEDDRVVPREPVSLFAQKTGAKIIIKKTGGHLSSRIITYKRNWEIISEFLRNSL